MKALFLTNEYPPHIYGGAGVHVSYLSRELAKSMEVEVRCFGDNENSSGTNPAVRGFEGRDEPIQLSETVAFGFRCDPALCRLQHVEDHG